MKFQIMNPKPFLLIGENFTRDDYRHEVYSTLSDAQTAAKQLQTRDDFQYCIYSLSSKKVEYQDVDFTPCEILVSAIIIYYEKHLTD